MSEYSVYFNPPGFNDYPRTVQDTVDHVALNAHVERTDVDDIYVRGTTIPHFENNDKIWIQTPSTNLPLASLRRYVDSPDQGPSSLLTGLNAYWKLNTDSWLDSSDDGNTLTGFNNVTVGIGRISGCVSISSNAYLSRSSTNFNVGTANITTSVWINPTTYGSGGFSDYAGSVLDFRNNGSGLEWLLIFNSSGNLRVYQNSQTYQSTVKIPLNTWTNIILSRNAGTTSFYINGSLDGTFADSKNFISQVFTFGGPVDQPGNAAYLHYNGRIDEVGVWSRALTGAEIASLFNAGVGRTFPFSVPLATWFEFSTLNRGDIIVVPSENTIDFPWGASGVTYDLFEFGQPSFTVPTLPTPPTGFKYKYYIGAQISQPTPPPITPVPNVPSPVINSPSTTTQEMNTAFSYQITASSTIPILLYGASGLPSGLSVNTTTGLISGTPTSASNNATVVTTATISAASGVGIDFENLVITLQQRPVITSSLTPLVFTTGTAITPYTITASKSPTSFGASSLPTGLSIDTATGIISGTPTSFGVSTVGLSATNSVLTGTANLPMTVNSVPSITSGNASGRQGVAFSYQITSVGYPAATSYGATGLPSGLTINTSTGLISGTPSGSGSVSVTLSATNSIGTRTTPVTFAIAPPLALIGQVRQVYPSSTYNLLFADQTNNAIRYYSGGSITTLATGITNPYGVVQTPNGTIYATSESTGIVYKRTGSTWTSVASGLTNPRGICADNDNNIYVAAGSSITKITNGGTVSIFASGMTNLYSVHLIYLSGGINHFMASGGNDGTGSTWQITTAGVVTLSPGSGGGLQSVKGVMPTSQWIISPLSYSFVSTQGAGPYSAQSQSGTTTFSSAQCGPGPISGGIISDGSVGTFYGPHTFSLGISSGGSPLFTVSSGFLDGPVT
jgi:hypothetical protein